MKLSFKTSKALQNNIERLPSGPKWKYEEITTSHAVNEPIMLYYRNPLECIEALIQNPLVKDYLTWVPYKLYADGKEPDDDEQSSQRVYTEWLSGDHAWEMQVCHFSHIRCQYLSWLVGPDSCWRSIVGHCFII